MDIVEASPGSFIYLKDDALTADECSHIIKVFNDHEEDQREGAVGLKHGVVVDRSIKRSMDVQIAAQPHWDKTCNILYNSFIAAMKELPEHFSTDKFVDGGFGVRKYDADGGFYDWHIDSGRPPYALRQMVMLWYLSDVEQGGETEFSHQSVAVKPKAGTLLMFPPFWTHRHRSKPVGKGIKYIATTWVSYG